MIIVKAENAHLQNELAIVKALLIKKDKEISELKSAVVDQRARSMKNNILLHNIPEEPSEDCELKLKIFLEKNTSLTKQDIKDIRIERAHRVGLTNAHLKRPRMIVAKLANFKDREKILSSWAIKKKSLDASKLKDLPNVTSHLPQEIVEQCSFNNQLVANVKKAAGGARVDSRFVGNKVLVNNQVIRPKVIKPSIEDILTFNEEEKISFQKIPRKISQTVTELGNTFIADAFSTKDIKSVRQAYKGIIADPKRGSASHNVLAYKVGNDVGWIDDGEHGGGRFLATWIKIQKYDNIAVIVTRQYGGEHLGSRRFELMKQVAKEAVGPIMGT